MNEFDAILTMEENKLNEYNDDVFQPSVSNVSNIPKPITRSKTTENFLDKKKRLFQMYFTNEKKNLIFVSFKYSDLNDPIGLSHFMVSVSGRITPVITTVFFNG